MTEKKEADPKKSIDPKQLICLSVEQKAQNAAQTLPQEVRKLILPLCITALDVVEQSGVLPATPNKPQPQRVK